MLSFLRRKLKALLFVIRKLYRTYLTINNAEKTLLPNKVYIKKLYKLKMGKRINLCNPRTFTEKLNWLKLYDQKSEYTNMVDKYRVRSYVKELIGEEYLVPMIGVWDSPDEIDFDTLPNKFVIKCNHDSNVYICNDKVLMDVEDKSGVKIRDFDMLRTELTNRLKVNYYYYFREWPYKNVKRNIICEEFMENSNGDVLVDYKVFCFNGVPKLVMVNSNRFSEGGTKTDIYDINWNHLDMQDGHYPVAGDIFKKPRCFDELISLSKILSKGIPFVRVDFNYWDHKLYFGELTFYHSAGLEAFEPNEWDEVLGSWLTLPKKKTNQFSRRVT